MTNQTHKYTKELSMSKELLTSINYIKEVHYDVKRKLDQEVIDNYVELLDKYISVGGNVKDNTVRLLTSTHPEIFKAFKIYGKKLNITIDPFLISALIVTGVIETPKIVNVFTLWLWFMDFNCSYFDVFEFRRLIIENGLINKKQMLKYYELCSY